MQASTLFESMSISLLSNALGSALFLLLTILLVVNWRGQIFGAILILASVISTLWFFSISFNAGAGDLA